jgi:hypothetical protein
MGWKAECVLISQTDEPFLEDYPEHDPEAGEDLLAKLGLSDRFERVGGSSFEMGIYPEDGSQLFVGAYPGGYALCRWEIVASLLEPNGADIGTRILDAFPEANVLCLGLHSVVNLFGYALYRRGVAVRRRWGAARDGIVTDEGEPLPEEIPLLEQAIERDGERIWVMDFDGEQEEFDEVAMGEEFVFEIARRVLGCRLDYYDIWELPMDEYRQKRRGCFSWLFGR